MLALGLWLWWDLRRTWPSMSGASPFWPHHEELNFPDH